MPEWYEIPCLFHKTKDGLYYQGVGTKSDPVVIRAGEIIEALTQIAGDGDNNVKGIRVYYAKIEGNLNILDAHNLKRVRKKGSGIEDIKLPVAELTFEHTIFDGDINFTSVQFGEWTSFSHAQFRNGTLFSHAQFGKITDFRNARFEKTGSDQKGTDFSDVQFGEETYFSKVQFCEWVHFVSARFGKVANFRNARFGAVADFRSAQFGKQTFFSHVPFGERTDFSFAQFEHPAQFDSVKYWSDSVRTNLVRFFTLACWPFKCFRKNPNWWDEFIKWLLRLSQDSPKGITQKPTQFYLDSKDIAEVSNPTFKRYVADHQFIRTFKKKHRFWYPLWFWTSDCGRNIWLWLLFLMIISFVFAGIYCFSFGCNSIAFNVENLKGEQPDFWGYLYYSVVTLTTLGFGDIVPLTNLARLVVGIEVVLGYVMLGGLISIFANKLARRS